MAEAVSGFLDRLAPLLWSAFLAACAAVGWLVKQALGIRGDIRDLQEQDRAREHSLRNARAQIAAIEERREKWQARREHVEERIFEKLDALTETLSEVRENVAAIRRNGHGGK